MAIAQSLLPEFDQEMAKTRKTLERVRDEKWDFKPHPESGTMGWLAGHLSNLPLWAVVTLNSPWCKQLIFYKAGGAAGYAIWRRTWQPTRRYGSDKRGSDDVRARAAREHA